MALQLERKVDGGSLSALKKVGQRVLHSPHHVPILLIYDEGSVYAVDNRCPHMGFPLDRGSFEDGIITCHWHHARFCLASGGTFDPFADDLQSYAVHIDGDQIWIDLSVTLDRRAYWLKRLQDGLQHGLNLVIAKAVTALIDMDVSVKDIVRVGAEFGCKFRRSWSPGLTILTAMANLASDLPREDRVMALYQGMVHVSRNTRGQTPRFSLGPLSDLQNQTTIDRHATWFRHFAEVRDEDGAERTLLTAIAQDASPVQLTEMIVAAATDHVYLDVGHVIDFINKSCELLDLIGWDHADWVLPSVVPLICNAQRSEELAAWRRPIDLIHILDGAVQRFHATSWDIKRQSTPLNDVESLVQQLLSDDPRAGLDALLTEYERGVSIHDLARAVALAAARRVLHFHTQNEFTDWDAVHHTFTYSNALQQLLLRAPSPEGFRGLLHGVLRLYLDRFLNVPVARIRSQLVQEESGHLQNGSDYIPRLENLLDVAGNVDRAAALTSAALSRYENDADDFSQLWTGLVRTVVREDADFHTLQNVEAAWRQFHEVDPAHRDIPMVAASRYIAAHAPTHRQLRQTAKVAMRLQAGESLHEE